jgi:hypothetical protein
MSQKFYIVFKPKKEPNFRRELYDRQNTFHYICMLFILKFDVIEHMSLYEIRDFLIKSGLTIDKIQMVADIVSQLDYVKFYRQFYNDKDGILVDIHVYDSIKVKTIEYTLREL